MKQKNKLNKDRLNISIPLGYSFRQFYTTLGNKIDKKSESTLVDKNIQHFKDYLKSLEDVYDDYKKNMNNFKY